MRMTLVPMIEVGWEKTAGGEKEEKTRSRWGVGDGGQLVHHLPLLPFSFPFDRPQPENQQKKNLLLYRE